MSHRIEVTNDKTGTKLVVPVIQAQGDAKCELCGKMAELRPYGPGGKNICYGCAVKDKARTEHNMRIQLFGNPGALR